MGSQDIMGVQVRHHLRGRRDGRDCGRINEMEVAWMQLRRMHTDQRDCVARIVNGDYSIALGMLGVVGRRTGNVDRINRTARYFPRELRSYLPASATLSAGWSETRFFTCRWRRRDRDQQRHDHAAAPKTIASAASC